MKTVFLSKTQLNSTQQVLTASRSQHDAFTEEYLPKSAVVELEKCAVNISNSLWTIVDTFTEFEKAPTTINPVYPQLKAYIAAIRFATTQAKKGA
jgi:hypothetical protein